MTLIDRMVLLFIFIACARVEFMASHSIGDLVYCLILALCYFIYASYLNEKKESSDDQA